MKHLINLTYFFLSFFLIPKWIYQFLVDSNFRFVTKAKLFWRQRINRLPESVWFHGSCIGEVSLLNPLVDLIEQHYPNLKINISTYTLDGYRYASTQFNNHQVFMLPCDMSWTMGQLVRTINPQLIILSELELWPNLLLAAGAHQVPVVVVNSRMNDKDYKYFKRIHFLLKRPLKSIQWWGAQTELDAERIQSLVNPENTVIQITGSMKYDSAFRSLNNKNSMTRNSLNYRDDDLILVAGSTHNPEESALLSVFANLRNRHPNFHLVLVPRQPDRSPEIATIVSRFDLQYELFSNLSEKISNPASVLIVDQVGLLSDFWNLCDFAFVGGSLGIDHGGQNMIEPASLGKPTCFGNSIYNFQQAATLLLEQDGAVMIHNESELLELIKNWINHTEKANQIGSRGAEVMETQRGASQMTFEAIENFLRK